MSSLLLLIAALQLPQPSVPIAIHPRPRFSIGANFSGMAATGDEGAGAGFAAGVGASVQLGARTDIDLRLTHVLDSDGVVVWNARWHRLLSPKSSLRPYVAAGLAGVAYKEIRFRDNVRREEWEFWRPPMLSLAAGWEAPAGRRFTVPLEADVMLHPYGLVLGTVSAGISWGPSSR
jgi:hypothetical protein